MDSPPFASSPRVTLKDVARAVGLSAAAVSLALRNSPEVAPSTRQRVQEMAREMGYQPNVMAAGLAQFKQDSKVKPIQDALAWLNFWPDPQRLRGYREFDLYWRGASASAEKFGYRVEEFVVNPAMPLRRVEEILRARGITGLLLPPAGPSDLTANWSDFDWQHFCAVRLGAPAEKIPAFHVVGSDQMRNTMLAFREVQQRGYQRIAYVGEPHRIWSYAAGFLWSQQLDVQAEARVPAFMFKAREVAEVQPAFVAWLEKEKPDAIITDQDQLPVMLKKAGYRVPEDIALAAMTVLDCPIDAGIYQNPEETGRVAVLVALSLIKDHARGLPPIPRQILIEGKWVDGSSMPRRA